jgi:hypothetical protein
VCSSDLWSGGPAEPLHHLTVQREDIRERGVLHYLNDRPGIASLLRPT